MKRKYTRESEMFKSIFSKFILLTVIIANAHLSAHAMELCECLKPNWRL